MAETYHDPVAQLLTLGDPRREGHPDSEEWRDYPALGLTAEHIPELARMARDQDLDEADPASPVVWARLHAWRALGQLRAESAVDALLQLLDRVDEYGDDWVQSDLPTVFEQIGPAAIPALRDFMADTEHGKWARVTAGESLVKIAGQFPDSREEVVTVITGQLRRFADQERIVNANLVNELCDLKAVESAAVIEQAFAAGVVDLSVMGDWEEAQILLGLLKKRSAPAPNFFEKEFGLHLPSGEPFIPGVPRAGHPAHRQSAKQKKAKRKQAEASRKRNRRR
jgi:hypothetical protein